MRPYKRIHVPNSLAEWLSEETVPLNSGNYSEGSQQSQPEEEARTSTVVSLVYLVHDATSCFNRRELVDPSPEIWNKIWRRLNEI